MKSANFKYSEQRGENQITIFGTVTLKDDGKTSISLNNASHYSANTRYMAKILANQIVSANFKHAAVESFKEDDKSLISILREYTADLHITYVQNCRDWEKENFSKTSIWLEKVSLLKGEDWFNFFQIEYSYVYPNTERQFVTVKREGATSGNYKKYLSINNRISIVKKYIADGETAAIIKAEKMANRHYEDSKSKLAFRIENKMMDVSKMTVVRSGIGMNINIVLTDGIVTVKAWTIFAEGEINKPHYRYLVK